jgi:hypothetical protein
VPDRVQHDHPSPARESTAFATSAQLAVQSGIDHFLFTIPHVAHSDYLSAVGEHIIPVVK